MSDELVNGKIRHAAFRRSCQVPPTGKRPPEGRTMNESDVFDLINMKLANYGVNCQSFFCLWIKKNGKFNLECKNGAKRIFCSMLKFHFSTP
ncbi:MAG: hypothetical protein DRI57_21530 [Deltaproteobacteria bacterium]|nr:MAG: hypothetical protein DRI57_21530 [Deltaproteobacteria bacterium]